MMSPFWFATHNITSFWTLCVFHNGSGKVSEIGQVLLSSSGPSQPIREEFPLQSGALEQLSLYATLDGNLDGAVRLAEQAVIQDRLSWSAWATRGLIRLLNGQRESAQLDLKSAWTRTSDEHFTGYPFWWLYFALLGDQPVAERWKAKAYAQVQSSFDQRLLDLIQSLIA